MKRLLALFLVLTLLVAFTGKAETVPEFTDMNDPNLLRYVEDNIYETLVTELDSSDFFIENVSAIYISQEYLEEVAYNTKANVFFGFTLEELASQFDGGRYVFTLGEDNTTQVKLFDDYDDTYDQVLRNIAIGSGVILVCVVVSVATAGAGTAAVSMIFAMGAKTATVAAVSSGAISGVATGIITGITTQDWDEALKAGALAGSESFKWGAITGAVSGMASEAIALKGATLKGLTMNEAAQIQRESGYPLDVIKEFKSMDQYKVCKEAGLLPKMVDGKLALVRDIDLNFTDELGRTNLQRMQKGLAALDPATGEAYELHHIGQQMDSTLAILSKAEHMQNGNNKIWHTFESASQIDRSEFDKQRAEFWKQVAKLLGGA